MRRILRAVVGGVATDDRQAGGAGGVQQGGGVDDRPFREGRTAKGEARVVKARWKSTTAMPTRLPKPTEAPP